MAGRVRDGRWRTQGCSPHTGGRVRPGGTGSTSGLNVGRRRIRNTVRLIAGILRTRRDNRPKLTAGARHSRNFGANVIQALPARPHVRPQSPRPVGPAPGRPSLPAPDAAHAVKSLIVSASFPPRPTVVPPASRMRARPRISAARGRVAGLGARVSGRGSGASGSRLWGRETGSRTGWSPRHEPGVRCAVPGARRPEPGVWRPESRVRSLVSGVR